MRAANHEGGEDEGNSLQSGNWRKFQFEVFDEWAFHVKAIAYYRAGSVPWCVGLFSLKLQIEQFVGEAKMSEPPIIFNYDTRATLRWLKRAGECLKAIMSERRLKINWHFRCLH